MNPFGGKKLASDVKEILNEHGYTKVCHPLEDTVKDVGRTCANINSKVFLYKWSGLIILTAVPIISTILSILASESPTESITAIVRYLSYSLTLLTLFNSIFKPKERFREVCSMGIRINDLRNAFLGKIETLPSAIEEEKLHALAAQFSKELVPFEKELIGLFLPETPAEVTGTATPEIIKGPKIVLETTKPRRETAIEGTRKSAA